MCNIYNPGDRFPSHIDSPNFFGPTICSLSLLSDYFMHFRKVKCVDDCGKKNRCSGNYFEADNKFDMDLPARSLLVMSGESRYQWTHGIRPRKLDILPDGNFRARKRRISVTFRRVL